MEKYMDADVKKLADDLLMTDPDSSKESADADTVFCDDADEYADAYVERYAADPRMRISNYIDL